MDWLGMIISVVAIFAGLFIYVAILHTKWGKDHENMQYFIMLICLLAAVGIGALLKWIVGIL